jgi:hypothetical protein
MPDAVKSPFLLPPYLASFCALFLLAFTLFAMAGAWLPLSSGAPAEAAELVLERGAAFAESCLPAALLAAAFLTALRVARNPISRPFSLLLPAATMFLILSLGPLGLALLGSRDGPALPAPAPSGYLVPGALLTVETPDGRTAVLTVSRLEDEGARLEDVVLLRDAPGESRLAWFRGGTAAATDDGAILRLGQGASEPRSAAAAEVRIRRPPIRAEISRPGELADGLLADLGALGDELRRAESDSELDSILLCAALAAFLSFSAVLLRMTRWPLFGIVLLGVLWRFALAGLRLAGEGLRPALGTLLPVSAGFVARNSPAILLLAVALLALVVDIVFVPFDHWRRELGL